MKTVKQLLDLIDARNLMLAERMPLGCISYANGEISKTAVHVRSRAMDVAMDEYFKYKVASA